jgi:hypothetical protein
VNPEDVAAGRHSSPSRTEHLTRPWTPPYFIGPRYTNYGSAVLSRTVARVNTVLMLHADVPLPAADIARAAEVAYTPAVSALGTLEKRGLALRTRKAGRDEFEPDHRSPHYPMAYATGLVDLPLTDALRGQRVYAVYAYGSLALPGGGSRTSDLDLLLVGDVKDRASMFERLTVIGTRLNRVIDAFVLSPEQFEHGKAQQDQHVLSALAGIRILGNL